MQSTAVKHSSQQLVLHEWHIFCIEFDYRRHFHHTGPFTNPSLTSLSVNLTTSNISWNLPSEDQTPLATFIYSILLIRNRNGTVVYNMTTQSQSLIYSIPDPCNTYDVTVSALYQNPSTTCIINSSVPLTGGKLTNIQCVYKKGF